MDGWNTIVSFWDGLFSGAMLVLGSVSTPHLTCKFACLVVGQKCQRYSPNGGEKMVMNPMVGSVKNHQQKTNPRV